MISLGLKGLYSMIWLKLEAGGNEHGIQGAAIEHIPEARAVSGNQREIAIC